MKRNSNKRPRVSTTNMESIYQLIDKRLARPEPNAMDYTSSTPGLNQDSDHAVQDVAAEDDGDNYSRIENVAYAGPTTEYAGNV